MGCLKNLVCPTIYSFWTVIFMSSTNIWARSEMQFELQSPISFPTTITVNTNTGVDSSLTFVGQILKRYSCQVVQYVVLYWIKRKRRNLQQCQLLVSIQPCPRQWLDWVGWLDLFYGITTLVWLFNARSCLYIYIYI